MGLISRIPHIAIRSGSFFTAQVFLTTQVSLRRRFSLQRRFPLHRRFSFGAGFPTAADFLYSGRFPLQISLTRFLSDRSNIFLRKILKHKHFLHLGPSRPITSALLAVVWHVFCKGVVRSIAASGAGLVKTSLNAMKPGP